MLSPAGFSFQKRNSITQKSSKFRYKTGKYRENNHIILRNQYKQKMQYILKGDKVFSKYYVEVEIIIHTSFHKVYTMQ